LSSGCRLKSTPRNGVVSGNVARIDPAVQNGTVTVDVHITGDMSKPARAPTSPSMARLNSSGSRRHQRRSPAFGQEKSQVGIFKANGDKSTATEAVRVQVKLGRSSVNTIEIVSGLLPGDWSSSPTCRSGTRTSGSS